MDTQMDILRGRRSIRRYQEKEITDEVLNQLLEAVKWSPSWANSQCWEVIVVKDAAIKEDLQETLSKTNPARKAFMQAPVILVLCGRQKSAGFRKDQASTKFGDWFMFDLGIAAQSICLAAYSMGLGSVIVGSLDHDRAKKMLGVGLGYELAVLIPVGYPAKDSPAPKRRDIGEFTYYNRFVTAQVDRQ